LVEETTATKKKKRENGRKERDSVSRQEEVKSLASCDDAARLNKE
jgi:hypothetical protein